MLIYIYIIYIMIDKTRYVKELLMFWPCKHNIMVVISNKNILKEIRHDYYLKNKSLLTFNTYLYNNIQR